MAGLLVLPGPAESLQTLAEKLEHTGLVKKEMVASVPQSQQLTREPKPLLPKGKGTEPSVQIVRRKRVKMSESRTLTREWGS